MGDESMCSHSQEHGRSRRFLRVGCLLGLMLGLLLPIVERASAHQDPVSCSTTGIGLSLAVLHADGLTPLDVTDIVVEGETINFRATLTPGPLPTDCAYGSGTWTITK